MEKIRIKCPVCGAVLEVIDNPANAEKNVVCPNCKEKRKYKEFMRVVPKAAPMDDSTDLELPKSSDATELTGKSENTPGYLLDKKTGLRYELREGHFTVGRKPATNPPKADIPIVTNDMGMSRVHMTMKVTLARDGRYHVYVANAENKNATLVNGVLLKDGDMVGLKDKDIVRLCDTELQYFGAVVDDRTELGIVKKK